MQGTTLAVISLIVLVATIIIGLKFKNLPLGVLSIAVAFVLGMFVTPEGTGAAMSAGKAKDLISGFNYSMFLTLVSVSIFFGIGQQNGSLSKLTKKTVYSIGRYFGRPSMDPVMLIKIPFTRAAERSEKAVRI